MHGLHYVIQNQRSNWIPGLIKVFAMCKGHFVGFVMEWHNVNYIVNWSFSDFFLNIPRTNNKTSKVNQQSVLNL